MSSKLDRETQRKARIILEQWDPDKEQSYVNAIRMIEALVGLGDSGLNKILASLFLEEAPTWYFSNITQYLLQRAVPINDEDFQDSRYYDFVSHIREHLYDEINYD